MALTALAGGSIFGARHGDGPPRVLALHGWGRTHSDFDACLDGIDALAVDLPGFGASPPPAEAGAGALYAGLVDPVLDECALPAVLVGHSFGGRVAVHLAQRRPAAVAGLVLAGVPLLHRADRTAAPSLGYRLARLAHRIGLLGDDRMEDMRRRHGSAEYRAVTGVMRDVFVTAVNESYEDQLRAIRAPIELVWGEHDEAVPLEVATRAQTMAHNAHLTILPDIDHFVPTAAPAAMRDAIDQRLAEVSQ